MRYLAGLMAIIKILIPLIVCLGLARLVGEIVYQIGNHIWWKTWRRRIQRRNGIRLVDTPRYGRRNR